MKKIRVTCFGHAVPVPANGGRTFAFWVGNGMRGCGVGGGAVRLDEVIYVSVCAQSLTYFRCDEFRFH